MEYQLSPPFKLVILITAIIWVLIFVACFLLYQQLSSVSTQLVAVQTELTRLTQQSPSTASAAQSEIIAKIRQENQEIKKLLVDNLQARSQTDVQLIQQIANTNKLVAQQVETMQNNLKSNERLLKQLDNTQQILSKVANSLK